MNRTRTWVALLTATTLALGTALTVSAGVAAASPPSAVATVSQLTAAAGTYSRTCTNPPPALPPGENITVSGNRLMAGGRPFVVHAVIIEGMDASQAVLAQGTSTDNGAKVSLVTEKQARKAFGKAELHAARCYGANTVRMHIAQPSADPKNPEYSPSHLSEYVSAVKLARSEGLAVIADMQDEPLSGEHHSAGNPTEATLRAWRQLAPMLANIPGVMLELFNEPILMASTHDWQIWLKGGKAPRPHHIGTAMTVGTQQLVDTIRGLPARPRNPIVVMGLLAGGGGWTLQGMPALADPDHALAYSVHFPPTKDVVAVDELKWDDAFGTASATVPVMVGAFNVSSAKRCTGQAPGTASDFVTSYLTAHHIGIAGWAFDWPQSIFHKIGAATGDLTTFRHFSCGATGNAFGGDGQLLYSAFTSEGNGS